MKARHTFMDRSGTPAIGKPDGIVDASELAHPGNSDWPPLLAINALSFLATTSPTTQAQFHGTKGAGRADVQDASILAGITTSIRRWSSVIDSALSEALVGIVGDTECAICPLTSVDLQGHRIKRQDVIVVVVPHASARASRMITVLLLAVIIFASAFCVAFHFFMRIRSNQMKGVSS